MCQHLHTIFILAHAHQWNQIELADRLKHDPYINRMYADTYARETGSYVIASIYSTTVYTHFIM